uniref:Triple functional domain protein n=1 Tax=Lygus hesperus TaxID=30085 RepID=A0A0A9Y4N9_LYGHE
MSIDEAIAKAFLRSFPNAARRLSTFGSFTADPGTSEGANLTTNSPVNKRRVFSTKWLPQPLRKLSGAKVEKASPPDRPLLKKTPSDKRFKSPVPESSKTGTEGADEVPRTETNGEENEEEVVELPPPMAPISEPILVPNNEPQTLRTSTLSLEGATSADLAEIEQIVKERMEQHSEKQSKLSTTVTPDQVSTSSGEGETAIQKREYVIQELVDTERDYVRDLKLVVEGYMALMRDPNCEIPIPEDLAGGKDKMVFGNLEAIYEWHRDVFLKAVEQCLDSPGELGPLFKRSERKLFMYVVYCQNKPVSEFIVSEFDGYFEEIRQKLGHKLQLCDLLIKPVQRIMKYQLLLRDLYKYTERAKLISETEALRQALV